MPNAKPPDQSLHLPSLVIKNFRGIDELTIPRLGRVTLLAGKNGVGKTTVLDAVRIWAARGDRAMLAETLHNADEVKPQYNTDPFLNPPGSVVRPEAVPDWNALFYGRSTYTTESVLIGPTVGSDFLQIRWERFSDAERANLARTAEEFLSADDIWGIETKFWGKRTIFDPHDDRRQYPAARRPAYGPALPTDVACIALGPDVVTNSFIEEHLNVFALTDKEERAIEALNLVASPEIERVGMQDPGNRKGMRSARHPIVRPRGENEPIPLRSLGEGAVRIFGTALALAASSNGFLLIDEAENGIHHSIQSKFWNMVLQTAQRNNVQVLATTHSWDCVKGFAEASAELEDVEGVLVRLERVENQLRAVEYSERNLKAAAKYGIEVR